MIKVNGTNLNPHNFKADKHTVDTKTGEYKDIAHPINSDTREKIQKAILDKYFEEIN